MLALSVFLLAISYNYMHVNVMGPVALTTISFLLLHRECVVTQRETTDVPIRLHSAAILSSSLAGEHRLHNALVTLYTRTDRFLIILHAQSTTMVISR